MGPGDEGGAIKLEEWRMENDSSPTVWKMFRGVIDSENGPGCWVAAVVHWDLQPWNDAIQQEDGPPVVQNAIDREPLRTVLKFHDPE